MEIKIPDELNFEEQCKLLHGMLFEKEIEINRLKNQIYQLNEQLSGAIHHSNQLGYHNNQLAFQIDQYKFMADIWQKAHAELLLNKTSIIDPAEIQKKLESLKEKIVQE